MPLPSVQVSAQLLSRTAGEMDDGSIRLDYGLVDWNVRQFSDRQFGVRFGRIKNPLGFFNETRDVAFTRPGVFMPQSVYFDRVRDLMLSSDGLQFYGEWRGSKHDISVQAGLGYPLLDENVESTFLGRDWEGAIDNGSGVWTGKIGYEYAGGSLRFALSGAALSMHFDKGPNDPPVPLMKSGDVDLYLVIASAQYNVEYWSLTAEYLQQEVEWKGMGTLFDDRYPGRGWYLQLTRRLRQPLEFFVRYGVRYLNTKDKDGRLAEQTQGVPAHSRFAEDWTLGLRWDITPDIMLRFELQWVDGTAWLSNEENTPAATAGEWTMLSALVSYRF